MLRNFLALLTILVATTTSASDQTWPFPTTADELSADALLDLSYLNEAVAGQNGFVRLSDDGNGFLRGDGRPIRFWAVNTGLARKKGARLREHAKFLAKRGINMVRFHGQIPEIASDDGRLEDINEDQRDQLWRFASAMKSAGIYVTYSAYYPHSVNKKAVQRWRTPKDSPSMTGLIYFDPEVQAAYKGWLRELLVPENPYTGIPLKDDPALAILQMQNEDSLLFWTLGRLKGREARMLSARFGQFLRAKYGSMERARGAWRGASAPRPIGDVQDDWEGGIVALAGIWHLTREARGGRSELRIRDQVEFLTRLMRDWHQEVADFLTEEIGAQQLFNAGNWRTADDIVLDDLERYSYMAGDIAGVNRYVSRLHSGENQTWAIVNGDRFRSEGVLGRPLDLPVALRQPLGRPYIIPETLWVPPLWKQSEGPLLMAAYQALAGVDISYWFSTRESQWSPPGGANRFLPSIEKWTFATPMHLGMFPAAALMFRQGLVDPADPVVVETRKLDELWQRADPLVVGRQGFDPYRDRALRSRSTSSETRVSPYAFLVGPVQIDFAETSSARVSPELSGLIDETNRRVTSATGQLDWDWGQEIVMINAPGAQGVIGDLTKRAVFELDDLAVSSSNDYASVLAVPLDQEPLAQSKKILVQIGTIARPNGWAAKRIELEDGPAFEVTSFGGPPWQVTRFEGGITLQNPFVSQAIVLDPNGMLKRQVELSREGNSVQLRLPSDALYLVLQ